MTNNTNATPTSSEEESFSKSFSIPSFIFLIFILIMSLTGNILVILTFKSYRKLRTKTNYFVVSLAIADILVASTSMPIWGAYLLTGPDWRSLTTLVKFWTSIDILCGVSSIINLASISIERCLCIVRPLTYHTFMTSRKAILIILINWLLAFIMASVKFAFFDWKKPNYELLISILCFFLPLAIMCFAYRLIFKAARYQARQIALVVKGGVRNFFLSTEVRAAKTLGVVMGTFIVSWGPFFIMNLIHGFCPVNQNCVGAEAVTVAKWMHYSNSFYNPVVYACMNKEWRSAFASILFRGRACRKNNGDSSGRRGTLSELNTYYSSSNHNKTNIDQL